MNDGKIYWASARAALYSALAILFASWSNGCSTRRLIKMHDCEVKWKARAEYLSSHFQTNVVVAKIVTDNSHSHYDFNTVKLLLHKNAEMKYGVGKYVLEMEEYRPCPEHGGDARIYYTASLKEK